MSVLQCTGIRKVFKTRADEVVAIEHADLTLERGTMTAIVGSSGCGKTTLLNIIGFTMPATSGSLIVNNKDTTSFNERRSARYRADYFGYLIQDFALIERETVMQNIKVPMYFSTKSDLKRSFKRRAMDLLEEFELTAKARTPVRLLSGGQRQRVALVRALINEPFVILADEPTGQIDEKNAKLVYDLLRNVANRGKAVLIATHDPVLVKQCDRVLEMKAGVLR